MSDYTVSIAGLPDLTSKLVRWREGVADWTRFWPHVTEAFTRRELIWFRREGEGAWPPLSPGYAAYKAQVRPGRPMLVFDGDLRKSLTTKAAVHESSSRHLVLGSDVPYAMRHARGGGVRKRQPLMPAERLGAGIALRLQRFAGWRNATVVSP